VLRWPLPRRAGDAPCGGFTLIEVSVVLALVGVLAAATVPSLQRMLERSRRADAVAALMRVQIAQESFRAEHGLYASQLTQLRGAGGALSAEGWYRIDLQRDAGLAYEARATPRADGPMAGDRDCPVLQLRVHDGRADHAPSARCWNR
jgi:type IV pilus assembly protein PilE